MDRRNEGGGWERAYRCPLTDRYLERAFLSRLAVRVSAPSTGRRSPNKYDFHPCRPLNARKRCIRSAEVVDVLNPREILTRHTLDSKLTKKFTFDRSFGPESKQCDVYAVVVSPLIEEVLSGYNCTVFAYGQTDTEQN
ncbi:kinesin-like protein Klp61F, partial [Drosophila miranda]|uniref:kinesin-like protein Klp61F n=1 Tax=Drosophila miranda TaxID=7229 RepID=UPI00143F9A8D